MDDADGGGDTDLFHAWNRAQAERHPLLMVTEQAPPEWKVRLPDLRSRLAASAVARLGAPDDVLMRALFERQFVKRSEEHTSELQSLMRISYAVFCLKKKKIII